MKYTLRGAALAGVALAALIAVPAEANNHVIEDALKSRADLSAFYQGLLSTGVIGELQEGKAYTVFAPTNDAFSKLTLQYPCFFAVECKAQAAEVLRNHIVSGERHLGDVGRGGMMSMFTLGGEHITASEPYRDSFEIDGRKVLSQNQLLGSVLYRIDSIIATPKEMVQFTGREPVVVHAQGTDLPPRSPEGIIVTVTGETPAH